MTAITATGTTAALGLGFKQVPRLARWGRRMAPGRRAHLPAGDRRSAGATTLFARRRRPGNQGAGPPGAGRRKAAGRAGAGPPNRVRPARNSTTRSPPLARQQPATSAKSAGRPMQGPTRTNPRLPASKPALQRPLPACSLGDDPRPVPSRCQRRHNPCTVCQAHSGTVHRATEHPCAPASGSHQSAAASPTPAVGLSRGGCGSARCSRPTSHHSDLREPPKIIPVLNHTEINYLKQALDRGCRPGGVLPPIWQPGGDCPSWRRS